MDFTIPSFLILVFIAEMELMLGKVRTGRE